MEKLLALLLAMIAVSDATHGQTPKMYCHAVHGRYAIYANHDLLWVIDGRHFLVVTNSTLDAKLEKLGWEDWTVYADFKVCSTNHRAPRTWSVQDYVELKNYSNLRFRRR